jgi:saccharopine dehydrogenase (NADP+, L-glutamate forming)
MKKVLVLGAGLSASTLIRYLLEHAEAENWLVRIGDLHKDIARKKVDNHPRGEAFAIDVENSSSLEKEVSSSNIVISLLPSHLHQPVASACLKSGRHLVSTSYVTRDIMEMDKEARSKGVLFMMETGVDPGIGHMSAMQVIDRIRENGDQIIAFESAAGDLIAAPFDQNPWKFKFTWAPSNIVLAGQAGARFYHNGKFKYIPYHKIFQRIETIDIPGLGGFEVYPEGDSLRYQSAYGLYNVLTMFRGTIRHPGFCKAWDLLVQLGATDDSFVMDDTDNMTFREFTNSFLAYDIINPVESEIARYLGIEENSELMDKLSWLGLFGNKRIGIPGLTPARILQHILEQKWQLGPADRDMIIMQNQFDYLHLGSHRKIISNMVLMGEDHHHTALSISTGLPAAITAKLILQGRISLRGVRIPVFREIYAPVLEELAELGIWFTEKDIKLS